MGRSVVPFKRPRLVEEKEDESPRKDESSKKDEPSKKKFTAEQNLFKFLSKIAIYLSPGLHKGCLSYRRSLQPSKENIQYFKKRNFINFFFYFCGIFWPSWIRIRIPSADPDPKNANPCGSVSGPTTLVLRQGFMP